MSYETNPITNRLKITKGWKNPYFPTQTLNYSREMLLWFKVYLFLKAYLSFQQIRLLACEIRISENNTKILYLSVNKNRKEQKKNAKSKWRSKSFLYALKSPLTKVQTQDARFLLYQDFKSLKKISSFGVNSCQKKVFSKAWVNKNRNSSWVNIANFIFKARNRFKLKQQAYNKQKFALASNSLFSKPKNQQDLKQTYWISKQRQIFCLCAKIQKEVLLLEKIINVLPTLQYDQKPLDLKILLKNLTAQYGKKKQILARLQQVYHFSFHSNFRLQETKEVSITSVTYKIRKKQTKTRLKIFLLNLKKELISLRKQTLLFQNKPQSFLILKNQFWKSSRYCAPTNLKLRNTILSLYLLYGPKVKSYIERLFPLNQKNTNWIKYMFRSFLLTGSGIKTFKQSTLTSERYKFLPKQAINVSDLEPQRKKLFRKKIKFNSLIRNIWKRKLFSLTKTRIFTKKKKLFSWQTLRLLRFNQKTFPYNIRLKKRLKKKRWKRIIKSRRIKKISLAKKLNYRLPYRREYKNQLKLITNWKLKYLIQDFVQKYFAVRLNVKLLWPLAEFKNLKFYRIIFPKKTNTKTKRISLRTQIYTKHEILRKRYVFISKVTNHVSLKNTYTREIKQRVVLKKIRKVLNVSLTKKTESINYKSSLNSNKLKIAEKPAFLFPFKKSQLTYNIASRSWVLKSPKKNAYLSRKLKMLQVQGKKRLHWAAKARFMSDLVTTLTLFAKYLDPQPLAEALAKVIGNTKKHVSALKLVETVLRTLNFKRGVGYRICLTGRANGADKSNVLYLNKLNRNRPRQTFSKNVNFAMAQARATIGTFGIKIWVYY